MFVRIRFGDTCRYLHDYSHPASSHSQNFTSVSNTRTEQGPRAFVQGLDEREKAELRALLGMDDSAGPSDLSRGELEMLEHRYGLPRREDRAQYEHLSPQTRAHILGDFDEELEGLALPAALTGLSLSEAGSEEEMERGIPEHPPSRQVDSLFSDSYPPSSGHITPLLQSDSNNSPISSTSFGAPPLSSHERIASPEVRAIFGTDVPRGAVGWGQPREGERFKSWLEKQ